MTAARRPKARRSDLLDSLRWPAGRRHGTRAGHGPDGDVARELGVAAVTDAHRLIQAVFGDRRRLGGAGPAERLAAVAAMVLGRPGCLRAIPSSRPPVQCDRSAIRCAPPLGADLAAQGGKIAAAAHADIAVGPLGSLLVGGPPRCDEEGGGAGAGGGARRAVVRARGFRLHAHGSSSVPRWFPG